MVTTNPLHSRPFVALLTYRLFVILAYQIVAVVVGWHIYELTHEKLALGLIGLAEVIPYFCCALFAGYAVDHFNKKALGLMAALLFFVMTSSLAMIAGGIITWGGTALIYAIIALAGVARAFLGPVYNTLFAQILPRESFARGSGIGTSIFQFALAAGPAIGGVLIALSGKTLAYCAAAFCALIAATGMGLLPRLHTVTATQRPPIFTSIREGLRFVFSHQIVLGALALDMFAVLFGGAVAMLPAFVQDVLHTGPEGLGILRAAPAVGAVLVGLILAKTPPNRHAGRVLLIAVAGFGLAMIAFALSTSLWLSVAILAISGACDGVSVVLRSTILQLATPDEMRGRVSAINGIFIGSSNELGAFESGLAAEWLGLIRSVVLGGVITLLVVGATAKLAPKLRRLHVVDLH